MNDSYIEVGGENAPTVWAGPDATRLFAAIALATALDLYARRRLLVNRNYTPTKMLAAAGRLCGKTYRRGQHAEAWLDVRQWVNAMKAAMPVLDAREGRR